MLPSIKYTLENKDTYLKSPFELEMDMLRANEPWNQSYGFKKSQTFDIQTFKKNIKELGYENSEDLIDAVDNLKDDDPTMKIMNRSPDLANAGRNYKNGDSTNFEDMIKKLNETRQDRLKVGDDWKFNSTKDSNSYDKGVYYMLAGALNNMPDSVKSIMDKYLSPRIHTSPSSNSSQNARTNDVYIHPQKAWISPPVAPHEFEHAIQSIGVGSAYGSAITDPNEESRYFEGRDLQEPSFSHIPIFDPYMDEISKMNISKDQLRDADAAIANQRIRTGMMYKPIGDILKMIHLANLPYSDEYILPKGGYPMVNLSIPSSEIRDYYSKPDNLTPFSNNNKETHFAPTLLNPTVLQRELDASMNELQSKKGILNEISDPSSSLYDMYNANIEPLLKVRPKVIGNIDKYYRDYTSRHPEFIPSMTDFNIGTNPFKDNSTPWGQSTTGRKVA